MINAGKKDELVYNKTAIYISDKMSSCEFCDRFIILDKGKVNKEGSHASAGCPRALFYTVEFAGSVLSGNKGPGRKLKLEFFLGR